MKYCNPSGASSVNRRFSSRIKSANSCHLPKVGDRFTLGSYDGVVTRTAKRRVTEVRLTPAEKPEPEKNDDEKSHYGRMTSK